MICIQFARMSQRLIAHLSLSFLLIHQRDSIAIGHKTNNSIPSVMVTFSDEVKTCSCCGKQSTQQDVASFTTFGGSADLDLRPPPMQRNTIVAWIERCTHCGYCSNNIADEHGGARKAIIESALYQEQLSAPEYPALAKHFLCFSIILEQEKKLVEAAWQALRGAWACDDQQVMESAKQSRLRAARLIEESRAANLEFSKQRGLDRCIQADALRRAGEFQHAKILIEHLQGDEEEVIKNLFKFQHYLIDNGDTGCFTIGDAMKHAEKEKEKTN